ncbi:AMP-binding protein [Pseudohalioglobus lutimaris]|uniref:AMP-binding protein n=1 Tax=Pseudohalioglobus lutimaris TaxID=1737061 RepID=A0A2N5X3B9_9GAMM|nr:AMP-binding protein [Pseudohalioglobus lutimaris]PLW68950.1 AMP-binding protein [Pseudohalioglobus lutimaris]
MKLDLSSPEDRLLGKILDQQALHSGSTRFLVTDDVTITYAEAADLTNRLASGLAAAGIGPGDRVVILLGNCPEMVLLTLAVNKLGALWVPINTDFRGDWLLDSITRSRPAMIVTNRQLAPRLAELQAELPVATRVIVGDGAVEDETALRYESLLEHPALEPDYAAQDYGDTVSIMWTSGTTGKSKGVMQSHNNWIRAIVDGAAPMYDSREDDVCYCPLPLYNSGAWITCVYRALIEGIPLVLENKFSVSTFWERINHFGATQIFAIGAMGSFLMNAPESPQDRKNSLRTALIVPMAPDLWEAFEQRFGVRLLSAGMGMSECLLIANQLDCPAGVPSYALGRPPKDLDLKLCDDNGEEVADGEPGEICLRAKAPHVLFAGYFDAPEATAAAYRGDWFLTGDMARLDPETGVYFFSDRKKDSVRFAGRNISSMEVESVVRRHPEVADVAAYGIPCAEIDSEDELKLSVVRKPESKLTAEALCEFINSNAPYFFVPRYLDFVDSLPYTPTQKVQKYLLREQGNTEDTWDLKDSGFNVRR